LEGALTLRESLREFIGTLENTDEEELERKIRLVEALSNRGDSQNDVRINKHDGRREDEKME
jgi:hypothetical protein